MSPGAAHTSHITLVTPQGVGQNCESVALRKLEFSSGIQKSEQSRRQVVIQEHDYEAETEAMGSTDETKNKQQMVVLNKQSVRKQA